MTVDLISREFVPLRCVIALDGVSHEEWLGADASAIEQALIRVLARRPAARVTEKEVLDTFVGMSKRMFGSEWGARNHMNIEWRQLWERGRIIENDGVLFLTAGLSKSSPTDSDGARADEPAP